MPILKNDVFSANTKGYIDFKSPLFAGRAAARFLCIFRGLFSPFFEDFPEQITFFVLLYKTFYSHMPRLLEPLISYFDPWEKATDHGK